MTLASPAEAMAGAGISAVGLLAQVTLPVPKDLKSWPVTAIMGLLLLSTLAIIAYQNHMAAKTSLAASQAATESAKAVQGLTDKHDAESSNIKALTIELRENTRKSDEVITLMKAKPCLAGK